MTRSPTSRRRLLVEGWRFIPHSYAQVNQFQLLELMRCGLAALAHRDRPYLMPHWQAAAGLLPPEAEEELRRLPAPTAGEQFDAAYRIAAPYDFQASAEAARTFVFCTTEFKIVPRGSIAGGRPFADAFGESNATIVTPSQWSREGFVHSGANPDRVAVVPHGVDTTIFHPQEPPDRTAMRRQIGVDGFVFLNISTMTGNKGIPMLLKAFAAVLEKHPDCRLVLKGTDATYQCRQWFDEKFKLLTESEAQRVRPRTKYIGESLTANEMANLYRSADAYVSPYFAEGFNLPVLEAAACGLPVICTAGGPTDDFVQDDFALRINSKPIPIPTGINAGGSALEPNLDHLIVLMNRIVTDEAFAQRARSAGPAFAAANFTWRHAVARLMDVLFRS